MISNQSSSIPVLYSFRRCPYAMRARMALAVSKLDHVIREVSLKEKPAAMLQASPKGTVPVLVLADSRVIEESLDIMRWALTQDDPDKWLADNETANQAMNDLIAINDGPFKFHLDRMKYANRYEGADPGEHRREAVVLLAPLEDRLNHHAYLFGNAPSLADIAVFPFIRQFAHADVAVFAASSSPRLQAWLTGWEESALFQSIMIKYPVWQPSEHA